MKVVALIAITILVELIVAVAAIFAQTVTPVPLTDEQIKNIPASQIAATFDHQQKLIRTMMDTIADLKQQIVEAQPDMAKALSYNNKAIEKTDALQGQINTLQTQKDAADKCCTDYKVLAAKKDVAIWIRNSIIGALVLAIGVFLFLKLFLKTSLPFGL